MSPIALFLACLLALQPATATPSGSSCDLFDKRCKAEQSLQRAKTAKSDEHHARYYFYAYRDFLLLFDQTGDAKAVCKARRAFDQSVAVKGQSSAQRASFMADIEDLVSRERKAGVRCQNTPKRPAADPPRLAKRSAKEPASALTSTSSSGKATDEPDVSTSTPAVPPSPTGGEAAPLTTAPTDPLLPVTGRSPAPRETPRNADNESESPTPTPAVTPDVAAPTHNIDGPAKEWRSPAPRATTPRPGRELLIAGGATLSVGLGLSAAAGVMGGRMLDTWRESRALHEEAGPYGTVEQADRHAALERDYDRQRPLMVTTAVIGVGTLVVGAVLTGVGAKRLARATSRAMLLPAPGGLVVRARF
jgi:hypothetical protein